MVRRCVVVALVLSSLVAIGPPAQASFPGANGKIAFYDFLELFAGPGTYARIYSISPDGTDLEQLTSDSRDATTPAYSADGQRIAFASNAARDPARGRIYVMDADGQNVTLVTGYDGKRYVTSPTWSPDGTRIAFCMEPRNGLGRGRIIVVDVDGSNRTNISGDRRECLPDWSPDGTRLVVDQLRRGGKSKLVLMDPDGTDRTTLVRRGWNVDASWSPDGTEITFIRELFEPTRTYDLFTVDVATGVKTNVSATPNRIEWAPAWSPDGTSIAFERGRDIFEPADIWIAVLGAGSHRVTDTPNVDEYQVSWQPLKP